jgi:amino acid transporter
MTLSDLLGIAMPAIVLIVVIAVRGEPRWLRRPWLIKDTPRRAPIAAFFAVLLLAAIAHAIL